MSRAALLFGTGAAKAGTSWLYGDLQKYPDCKIPALKELGAECARLSLVAETESEPRAGVVKMRAETLAGVPDLALKFFDETGHEDKHQAVVLRSDYVSTLTRLEAAMPEPRRMAIFFEKLFSEGAIAKLCAFLGISYRAADLKKQVHAGVRLSLDEARQMAARNFLAPQYAFVKDRFGTVPQRWQDNMVMG